MGKSLENYKKTPGQVVQELRMAVGLSQEELAEELDCSTQTISNIECDRYFATDKAVKIAKLFGVPLEYVQGKTDDKYVYKKAVEGAISDMLRYAEAFDSVVEYVTVSSGMKTDDLSEKEKESLRKEIEWYGRVRLRRMIDERGENRNGKETKKGK